MSSDSPDPTVIVDEDSDEDDLVTETSHSSKAVVVPDDCLLQEEVRIDIEQVEGRITPDPEPEDDADSDKEVVDLLHSSSKKTKLVESVQDWKAL